MTVLTLISFAIAIAAALVGYVEARSFVRNKLRFVDAAQHFFAPLIAGVGAAIVATGWLTTVKGLLGSARHGGHARPRVI